MDTSILISIVTSGAVTGLVVGGLKLVDSYTKRRAAQGAREITGHVEYEKASIAGSEELRRQLMARNERLERENDELSAKYTDQLIRGIAEVHAIRDELAIHKADSARRQAEMELALKSAQDRASRLELEIQQLHTEYAAQKTELIAALNQAKEERDAGLVEVTKLRAEVARMQTMLATIQEGSV